MSGQASHREQLLGQALGDLLDALGRPMRDATGPQLLLAAEEAAHDLRRGGVTQAATEVATGDGGMQR